MRFPPTELIRNREQSERLRQWPWIIKWTTFLSLSGFLPSDSYRSSIFNKKPPDMNCVSFYLQNSGAVSQAAAFVFLFIPRSVKCAGDILLEEIHLAADLFVSWVTEVRLGGCNYRSGVHHVFSVSFQYLLFILFASSQTDFLSLLFSPVPSSPSSTSESFAAAFEAIKPDIFN